MGEKHHISLPKMCSTHILDVQARQKRQSTSFSTTTRVDLHLSDRIFVDDYVNEKLK